MTAVMIANTVIMATYAICVTFAAVHFNNPGILWWYLLLTMMGFTFSRRSDDNERKAD